MRHDLCHNLKSVIQTFNCRLLNEEYQENNQAQHNSAKWFKNQNLELQVMARQNLEYQQMLTLKGLQKKERKK